MHLHINSLVSMISEVSASQALTANHQNKVLLDWKCEVHFLQGMQSCSGVALEIPRATENPEVRCIFSGFYLLSTSEALREGDIQVLDVSGGTSLTLKRFGCTLSQPSASLFICLHRCRQKAKTV